MNKFSILCLTLAASFLNDARALGTEDLETYLTSKAPQLSGTSGIFVAQEDRTLGYVSPGVRENSQFYIGSVTKHMTVYMFLMALQDHHPGESFEDLMRANVGEVFPESALLDKVGKTWAGQVTLLELMTHKSGLSDYIDAYGDGRTQPEALNEPKEAIELLESATFDPEKTYSYSNTNYLFLAKLLEEFSGQTFESHFERVIKSPAGMCSSFAPLLGNYEALKELPSYSRLVPHLGHGKCLDMANAIGGGNVVSTPSDLIKWGNYFFKKAPRHIVEFMLRNHGYDEDGDISNLGFGTEMTPFGRLIGHQGSLDSFNSFFGYLPEHDLILAILTNSNQPGDSTQIGDFDALLGGLLEWMSLPRLLKSPSMRGQVLWSEPERLKWGMCYSYQGMRPFPYIDAGRGLSITFSPWSRPTECLKLALGLHKYNLGQQGIATEENLLLVSPPHLNGCAKVNPYNETVFLSMSKLVKDRPLENTEAILASAYAQGARRAFMLFEIPHGVEEDPTLSFREGGYTYSGELKSRKKHKKTILLTKTITPPASPSLDQVGWENEGQSDIKLGCFAHKFSFFVRDDEHQPVGGLWGKVFQGYDGKKYAEIEIFYMSPLIRGMGFGSKIMRLADNWMREQGIAVSALGTSDYQAPWFYRSWGYTEVFRIPKHEKTKTGALANSYCFEKELGSL